MSRRIKVNPAQLNTTAAQIDNAAGEYQKLFNKLFSDVGAMRAAWQGVDNQAFTSQIEGFRDDFQLMQQVMVEYANFLKQAAKTYEATQQEITAGARRLTN